MLRLSPLLLLTLLALALLPSSASAAYFGNLLIDGPDAGIKQVSDVDIARDGSGAVAYVKTIGGVDHAFVARLVNGAWQPPEQVDGGLPGPSSQPVVAASDGGRVAVGFVSGGALVSLVKPNAASGFGPAVVLGVGASNPSIDMSINGGGYITFTSGGDVRIARMDRLATSFTLLPGIIDINPADPAGLGTGRSQVAVSADGTAVVVWGELGQVYARRQFYDRPSTAPQLLNVPMLGGATGGSADLPALSIEDDSSFAWAVFRQGFSDGRQHTVARRLVGSAFEDDTKVDATPFGGADDTAAAQVDISGKGEGIAATSTAANGVQFAILHDDTFFPAVGLGFGNAIAPHALGVFDEVNDGYGLWMQGTSAADARIHAVAYDVKPSLRTVPPPGPDTAITDPGIDPSAGMDGGINRAGDATVVYVGDNGSGRRLLAAGFDRPPGAFRTYTTSKFRKFARPPLAWGQSFELQGPVSYQVIIDGKAYGTTADRKFTPVQPVPDGAHQWKVIAVDQRGQQTSTPVRTLRVDATPPEATFKVTGTKRKGKPVTVTVRAADGSLDAPSGSGIKTVRVAFGDGTVVSSRKAVHRYAKGGKFTVQVTVADQAGNIDVVKRQITVKKK